MMASVKMYTKPGCPYCAAAKDHYTKNGIAFDEFNVKESDDIKKEALSYSDGQRIVPIIVDDGKVTLGWNGG